MLTRSLSILGMNMIVCVRRADENAGNLISVVQFLIKVGIDDDNTGIFHVSELRTGMNKFDHRSFFFYRCDKKTATYTANDDK